jgi:predicted RNase H-like HicB family nuclease
MSSHKYQLVIWWSADDDVFVAEAPELPGCMAHGSTMSDAVKNVQDAMDLWLDVAREMGRAVPEPRGRTPMSA